MSDQVAVASKAGKLPVQYASRHPDVMPLCHQVDQHTSPMVFQIPGLFSSAYYTGMDYP